VDAECRDGGKNGSGRDAEPDGQAEDQPFDLSLFIAGEPAHEELADGRAQHE
jgi:hypothetical protein